jgi:steroid 5-alpha reductase family enzyme
MIEWHAYLWSLLAITMLGLLFWLVSLIRRDVSVVDSAWSLLFLGGLIAYLAASTAPPGPRTALIVALVAVWALRLSAYITWRNWGEGEDRRYQAMRQKHQPGFAVKSLYLVFGLQGLLAWGIALPLAAAVSATGPLNLLDLAGVALWTLGMLFEALGDYQLARFKAQPQNRGRVMDRGLWRYTRHPNYFGECCIWWGFYLLALAAGGWWTLLSPVLMTFLLLRVSGVALLERDIGERRPGYRDYVQRTSAFLPRPPRQSTAPVSRPGVPS